ncbi:antibiotic biosynthesis monooxygenase [Streptomyces sp. NPDC020875]|uniref:antibiotic biosynthesis monooxygenase n=1 Tax=Streptomyces sp. NPDC020875 TaxID=3154898 RepID=UPI00340598C3
MSAESVKSAYGSGSGARPTVVVPHARPDLGREGVGVVKVSTWDVGTPERQRAVLAAIETAWTRHGWPEAGLLSYTVHVGDDGRTLLHYSQWADEGSYERFFAEVRSGRNAEIDTAVPGIERLGLHVYELYREGRGDAGDPRVPGSVVIVEIEFDGPDPDRQRAWVDGVFAAMAADPLFDGDGTEPERGRRPQDAGIGGWFHLGTDGTRVLNYAEWETAEAHAAALEGPGGGVGSDTEEWRRVHDYPGIRESRVRRYTPGLSLRPGA